MLPLAKSRGLLPAFSSLVVKAMIDKELPKIPGNIGIYMDTQ